MYYYIPPFSLAPLLDNDVFGVFPELFLAISTMVLLVFGVVWSTSRVHGYPLLVQTMSWLSVWALLCTLALCVHMPCHVMVSFVNSFVHDDVTVFFKTLILVGACASLLMSMEYVRTSHVNVFEYGILVCLATCSMLVLVSSYDFIAMYLAIEMQSLCLYVLASSKRHSEFSTEAGLKYFLLGAFSSGILLFGCSLVYGCTGMTNLEDVAKALIMVHTMDGMHALQHIGMVLILIGFLFKLTAAPFHFWAPDVYEGAPTCVTAFFAIVPKIALLAMVLRLLLGCFYDLLWTWQYVLFVCCICSFVIGSFGAMAQKKLKRMMVYSSVGHVGYLLMGLCCGTLEGVHAMLLYLVLYMVMTITMFATMLACVDHTGTSRLVYVSDLSCLAHSHPIAALTVSICLFSMAGIPPLAGFCSKFYVFFAAMGASLYSLAILGVLSSVVSCFYYIRVVKTMYFDVPSHMVTFAPMDHAKAILLALTTWITLFFFLFPQSVFLWTYKLAYVCMS